MRTAAGVEEEEEEEDGDGGAEARLFFFVSRELGLGERRNFNI
jgi:hypothetical protein